MGLPLVGGITKILKKTPTIGFFVSLDNLTKRDRYNHNYKNRISRDRMDLKDLKQKSLEWATLCSLEENKD